MFFSHPVISSAMTPAGHNLATNVNSSLLHHSSYSDQTLLPFCYNSSKLTSDAEFGQGHSVFNDFLPSSSTGSTTSCDIDVNLSGSPSVSDHLTGGGCIQHPGLTAQMRSRLGCCGYADGTSGRVRGCAEYDGNAVNPEADWNFMDTNQQILSSRFPAQTECHDIPHTSSYFSSCTSQTQPVLVHGNFPQSSCASSNCACHSELQLPPSDSSLLADCHLLAFSDTSAGQHSSMHVNQSSHFPACAFTSPPLIATSYADVAKSVIPLTTNSPQDEPHAVTLEEFHQTTQLKLLADVHSKHSLLTGICSSSEPTRSMWLGTEKVTAVSSDPLSMYDLDPVDQPLISNPASKERFLPRVELDSLSSLDPTDDSSNLQTTISPNRIVRDFVCPDASVNDDCTTEFSKSVYSHNSDISHTDTSATLLSKEKENMSCKKLKATKKPVLESRQPEKIFFDPRRIFMSTQKNLSRPVRCVSTADENFEHPLRNDACDITKKSDKGEFVNNDKSEAAAASAAAAPSPTTDGMPSLRHNSTKKSSQADSTIHQNVSVDHQWTVPQNAGCSKSRHYNYRRGSSVATGCRDVPPAAHHSPKAGWQAVDSQPVEETVILKHRKYFWDRSSWDKHRQVIEQLVWQAVTVLWNIIKLVIGIIVFELFTVVKFLCESLIQFVSVHVGQLLIKLRLCSVKYNPWHSVFSRHRLLPKSHHLTENISLPSTGEEAMRRLFACKEKDPYSILGLKVDCSDEDIRKYYRRQAVLVHPDKNPEPGADEAFKILNRAFEMIGETDKRQQYDLQTAKNHASDAAMQEFSDLLTKLHETMKEAINMMACSHCGGKHRRYPVDVRVSAARYCARCKVRHSAREGDVWAESSVFGFRWHYMACMDGSVYDITEWASCQQGDFKHLKADSHFVMIHISTGSSNKQHHRSTAEADLEGLFNSMFSGTASNKGFSATFDNTSNNTQPQQTTAVPTARKRRKKRR
jgi:hypothetical protein